MFENLTTYILLSPLIYLSATLTFYLVSYLNLSPHASFFARTLASTFCLLTCATYGVLASLFLRLRGNPGIAQWATARAFHHMMWFATGVRFDIVSGREHLAEMEAHPPMVLVGNHQSALDVLLLGAIFPRYCSVTAKAELRNVPILGWFMRLSGTVFIDRGDRERARRAFEGAAGEMMHPHSHGGGKAGEGEKGKGQSVFIFPEGTRRSSKEVGQLGGFKKGAFHLAVQAQVPIVVCVCANYWGVCSLKEWRFRAGRVPVKVLPPIPTKGLTAADVDSLTSKVRDMMLQELIALSQTPAGRRAISIDPDSVEEEEEEGGIAMGTGDKGREAVGVTSGAER